MAAGLTKPQLWALAVLVEGDRLGWAVRSSNHTTTRDRLRVSVHRGENPGLTVYWQVAERFADRRLVTIGGASGWDVELTDAGREAAVEAGLL